MRPAKSMHNGGVLEFQVVLKFTSFVDCSYTGIPCRQCGHTAESEAAWLEPEDRKLPSIHNSIVALPSRSMVAVVHCYRAKFQRRSNFDEPRLRSRAVSPNRHEN